MVNFICMFVTIHLFMHGVLLVFLVGLMSLHCSTVFSKLLSLLAIIQSPLYIH